jgi:hypothetical protein
VRKLAENSFGLLSYTCRSSPPTSSIELISKGHERENLRNTTPTTWRQTTDVNRCYVHAVVGIHATGLSELSNPERLVAVHLEIETFKESNSSLHLVHGDNDVVPVDINVPQHFTNVARRDR